MKEKPRPCPRGSSRAFTWLAPAGDWGAMRPPAAGVDRGSAAYPRQREPCSKMRAGEKSMPTRIVPAPSLRTSVQPPRASLTQPAPLEQRPVGGEAHAHLEATAGGRAQGERVRPDRRRDRRALRQRGRVAHGEQPPVRRAPDFAQVGQPARDQATLRCAGEVQAHVRQRDVGDRVFCQPRPVGRRGQPRAVEERPVARVQLALPAARQQDRPPSTRALLRHTDSQCAPVCGTSTRSGIPPASPRSSATSGA